MDEGSLDPLGLAPLADRLADTIAPGVTARMSRVRLVTAMAVCAVISERFAQRIAVDRVTPAWLACEWHVVEALCSADLPPGALRGVPGSAKTRTALGRGHHLDARSYLKSPKVFGFHGVYKRLAENLGVVDGSLALTERGWELVATWEREQDLPGFLQGGAGTGSQLRKQLERAVERALDTGVAQPLPQTVRTRLADALRPDDGGARERTMLWEWLVDPVEPIRREVVTRLAGLPSSVSTEREAVQWLRDQASPGLAERLDAIDAYETLCCTLTRAFDACRIIGRQFGLGGFTIHQAAQRSEIETATREAPSQFEHASACVGALGLQPLLDGALGGVASPGTAEQFVEALLDRHETVQEHKPPTGKRPWFERTATRVFVRPAYGLDDHLFPPDVYVHPMRVRAMYSFCQDLRP